MPELPSGTVTFLFTDIEGSTRLWEQHPEAMAAALARHDGIVREAIERQGGHVFKTIGDQFCAAFAAAPDALAATLAGQRALRAEPWPSSTPLRVRMALHTGAAEARDGDYFGAALNRVARMLAAGHGGQILLSQAAARSLEASLPSGAALRDLGAHRLKDLAQPELIFCLEHPDLPPVDLPLRSLQAFSHNLPVQMTRFVGREAEVDALKQRLSTTRLLTLTGSGGTGKTRLSLQVAADRVDQYADGVWWVELAPIADPALVPQAVAVALGLKEEPGRALTDTLVDHLRAKQLLLLLDNCEHLLAASAALAAAVLGACPGVTILASSREGLNIPGETVWRVPSLSHPDPQRLPPLAELARYEAVQLFLDRATGAHSSFALTDQNALNVAQICHRLDGIPLCLELAAARVKALPVETLNERLDNMFRLLTGGSRTALPRQQTLRALIDWSYHLLTEPERLLLRRLSVFAGGWTLEAAEAVCSDFGFRVPSGRLDFGLGPTTTSDRPESLSLPAIQNTKSKIQNEDVLDLLTALVEKSLVDYGEREGEGRYRLLETVRQYARDRLMESGEGARVRDRHRDLFLQLAERAEPELNGHEQFEWLDRLEREHDNLRAALEWSQAEEDSGEAARSGWSELRLAGALWWFWLKRSYYSEGRRRAEAALSRGGEAPALARIKALLAAGVLSHFPGDYLSGDRCFEEALALSRAVGHRWGEAFSLLGLAMSVILRMFATGSRQECEQAAALAEDAVAMARETGDRLLIAITLRAPGFAAELRGDYARATACVDEMLALSREVGDTWNAADALGHLARLADYQGDPERARALYQEALALSRLEVKRTTITCLRGLAELAAELQQAGRAARLWGAAEALRETSNDAPGAFWHASHDQNMAAVRAALGETAFEAVWTEGRAMALEQAIRYALEEPADAYLPGGTVTFLFTDIEGSTRLWEQHPAAMQHALARHDVLLTAGIQQHGGVVVKSRGEGDSFFAVFAHAPQAVAAAGALQQALITEPWSAHPPLQVRMAVHTTDAEFRQGDYYGLGVNRCARLRAVAHGGQVLLSLATADRVPDQLPEGAGLRDLGAHRLKDLQQPEHVFQLLSPNLPAEFPPLRSLEAFTHNLPAQLTSFIGREEAMAEVKQFLATTRLLTLTGSGGCGKTRLALQVAADLLEEYTEGVWLVELAPLADPALVPQRVASALGVREQPGRPLTETLVDYLKPRALLLILDNCEHLLAACAQLADTLLRSCPSLRILASSREGLGIAGEQTYRVPSLSRPDARQLPPLERLRDFEAVQLFADRARLSQATFAVTQANARSVAQVCQRLDGIPLAIELAAARVRALPVEQIHARLDDMFRLLTGGSRAALPRQQTLRALIDWSYELLAAAEQTLLRHLSVFAGGWTLEAAEAVGAGDDVEAWEVLDLLTSLVDKSLVLYDEAAGEGRYRLLETVRQYARDRLLESGETNNVRTRHMEHYGRLAEGVVREFWTPKGPQLGSRLLPEFDNLNAARDWAAAEPTRSDTRLWVTTSLGWLWFIHGYLREDHEQLEAALAMDRSAPVEARVSALLVVANFAYHLGDYRQMQSRLEESLALSREAGLPRQVAVSLAYLGLHALATGDDDRAAQRRSEALSMACAASEEWVTAFTLYISSLLSYQAGDYRRSRAEAEECLAYFRQVHDPMLLPYSIVQAAHAAQEEGDLERAQALYAEELARSLKNGHKLMLERALEGLAWLLGKRGKWEVSARLLGAAAALRDSLNAPQQSWRRRVHEQAEAACRSALGDEAFQAPFAEGRAMPLEAVVQYGLTESADA